jgi:CheY-like chemotaxis protein
MCGAKPVPEKTILIIEDSELNRRLLQVVLEPHGYRLLTAKDGGTGIMLARPDPDGYFAARYEWL